MTTRERVLAALRHQTPDRCPVYAWFDEEFAAGLAAALNVNDWDSLLNALGVDRFLEVELDYEIPEERAAQARAFVPARFQKDRHVHISDDGHVFSLPPDGDEMPELIFCPLEDAASVGDVQAYPFVSPADVVSWEQAAQQVAAIRDLDAVAQAALVQPFQFMAMMRGSENAVHDFELHPDLADFLYEKIYAFLTAQATAYAKAGVDLIQLNGALADEEGLAITLDAWRNLEKARLAKLVAAVKQANRNCFVGIQSEGDFREILPELVELGIDFISPSQVALMSPGSLKQEYGKDLVLHGCMDAWGDLIELGPGKIRKRTCKLIERCGKDGGLILGPTDILGPEHAVETVLAFYQAATDL